jgi:glycosyltransferase involved in cell wall biosynthesis
MSKKNYGILVTTKDRESYLAAFLESVSKLYKKPEQIVIVSTGKKIERLIDKYRLVLNINHMHSEKGGQTFQKKLGINLLNTTLEWVLFCDDDILLFPNTIAELFSFEEAADESKNIVGVGLMDLSNKIIEYRRIERIGRALFRLSDSVPGKVLRNGYNSNYMNSPYSIRTEWLNGVALWRKDVVFNYAVNLDNVKHAYGEDLIFSYTQSKYGEMYYCPASKYVTQDQSLVVNIEQTFYEKSYHNLYIAKLFSEISVISFYWLQIGRTIAFLYTNRKRLKLIFFAINVFMDISNLIAKNASASKILNCRINNLP